MIENKVYKLTDEEFIDLVKSSLNISEVLFKLGYSTKGNSWGYSLVKQRMADLNISGTEFRGKSPLTKPKTVNKEKLFSENSKHSRHALRTTIIRENLLPYKCAICGITEWNGKTLSLELDHINGINNDNRLENLRFLCPNCHSQTDTYGSKNSKITESKYDISEELSNKIVSEYLELKNIVKVSEKLGISRKAIKQALSEANISKPNQKYVIRYDKDWNELKRYGSLVETAKDLIESGEVKTKRIKTCTRTIMYNKDNFWLNSYWKILDDSGIINNPLLEPSLIDSENTVDEAQAKAA